MYGSRKVKKGEDKGRIYTILATLVSDADDIYCQAQIKGENGNFFWRSILHSIASTREKEVELCSIHKYL